jgi:hypothetical protein
LAIHLNREQFLALLRDSTIAEKHIDEVKILTDKYPYSQPLRALLAKSSKKADPSNFNKRISTAAIYAVDRSALKAYIENTDQQAKTRVKPKAGAPALKPKTTTKTAASANKPPVPKRAPQKTVNAPSSPKPAAAKARFKPVTDAEALRKEVLHNLQELIKHKEEIALLFAEEKKTPEKTTSPKAANSRSAPTTKKTDTEPAVTKKTPAKKTAPKPKAAQKKSPKIETQGSSELINKFIKTSPSIVRNKKTIGEQVDLSIQSVEFNDDLVSENLAEIFARQGKTKKAIEIYRKLIWKFPQKKAFFASRIEEIKLRN